MITCIRALAFCVAGATAPGIAAAQTSGGAVAQPAAAQPDPDLQVVPAEPEFTLGALPTSLRMPAGRFAFRLTHRFSRPIASGSVGDFFADFFGFDSSSRVGVELRYGIRRGTQFTFHRTNDRAIQFYGQHELLAQTDSRGFAVNLIAAVEGDDNFSKTFGGSAGGILSRRFGDRGAVYAQPLVVFNTDEFDLPDTESYTALVGLGARFRVARRSYVMAEAAPRVGGFRPDVDHVSVGVEHRTGNHMFQLTITNSFGTTLRQVARGGIAHDTWFIGFNLTRRFY